MARNMATKSPKVPPGQANKTLPAQAVAKGLNRGLNRGLIGKPGVQIRDFGTITGMFKRRRRKI